ncbi:uncharacterized protein [Linepithema humile]|uniref:uncharacterized protein n=1 Tax=Linepithema humile TaxID=83485 RepID=UPI00351F26E2
MVEHGSVKINSMFNGEFIAGNKTAVKTIATKNRELFPTSDLNEWYTKHVVDAILTSLEEFQERDSGWALSRILDLTINVNKAVVNVQSTDNACFAWAVVAALHPAEKHPERVSQYTHYSTVLNLCGRSIIPLRLTDDKKEKHVNLLHVPGNNEVHFVLIKNLFRLVSSQLCKREHRQHICDRCLHYFRTSEKLSVHSVDCGKMNNCAVILPNEDNKWLTFRNYNRKERLPFVVYADLECTLEKKGQNHTAYAYQHHKAFSIGYYVFPYEYIDSVDKLRETCLPPRESFYSSLTGKTVSESDYAHATNVCYGLDPAQYYTLPGYTWDAMLKHTGIKFELLTDIDMVMFVERGIRGGLSQYSNRYARANNKYMPSYDPLKPLSYLMYFDVNNLYGWAMCQLLPYADFQWVENVASFDVMSVTSDSATGYVLEVDLAYPMNLYDAHTDLPFCPTRDKPPGKREVTKIHRIFQFAQSPWLRGYIELNTQFRTLASNEFEKNLNKLMNNAVFGKTMENVRNHTDVRLVTQWEGRYGAEAMIAKPNFHSRSVFSENLIAVELRKLEVKFDKPIYVGMCILDISKTCLYEFHYEYMAPLYRDNCKIIYTDTDSLIYFLQCENVYHDIKRNLLKFDTSDYFEDNIYDILRANKKIPGLMKDENNGAIMTEFVGLRAKMYALRVTGQKDAKKVKGVKKSVVVRTITFDDYTRCLNDDIELTRRQSYPIKDARSVHRVRVEACAQSVR